MRIKRLTECHECQARVDRLQALLDARYLAEFDAGAQLKKAGVANDTKEGSAQQNVGNAMQKDASAGLGGLTTAEIGKKAKLSMGRGETTRAARYPRGPIVCSRDGRISARGQPSGLQA